MRQFIHNLGYSAKVLLKNKIFSLIIIAILGLGVCSAMVLYTYLSKNYLSPAMVKPEGSNEVYVLQLRNTKNQRASFNHDDLIDVGELIGSQGTIEPITEEFVKAQSTLKTRIVTLVEFNETISDWFSLAKMSDQSTNSCYLSYEANDKLFDGTNSVGRELILNGVPFKVIGVGKRGEFRFLNLFAEDAEVLVPPGAISKVVSEPQKTTYSMFFFKLNDSSSNKAGIIEEIYQYVNDFVLPTRRGGEQELVPIELLNTVISELYRDSFAERSILMIMVALSFAIILFNHLNLFIIFNLNRLKNVGIQVLVGGSVGTIFQQLFLQMLILTSLGFFLVIPLMKVINYILILFQQGIVQVDWNFLFVVAGVLLCTTFISSIVSLRKILDNNPLHSIKSY